jgi:hypothetical protein
LVFGFGIDIQNFRVGVLKKERSITSPDGSGNPFAPAFTSSVRFARVAQKIGNVQREEAPNYFYTATVDNKGKTFASKKGNRFGGFHFLVIFTK